MTIEAFLTRGQDRIQAGMLDTCRIVNGVTATFDATTGVSVEVDGPVVYTGRCKIKPAETTVNERTEGDADYAHRVYEAHLPIDAPVVPRGAYLIVTSTRDLALTGARFIVRDTAASTLAVQRKLYMERDR